VTREALRFHYLIVQLEREGNSQRTIAAQIGCHQSLISKWRRPEANGRRTGIGAEIVRGCKEGLGLDPGFFFEDYDGERDYHQYVRAERGKANDARSPRKHDDVDTKAALLTKQLADAQRLLNELTASAAKARPRRSKRRDPN
jgi:hypothetical protein